MSVTPAVLSKAAINASNIGLSWSNASGGSAPLVTHLWKGEARNDALTIDLGIVSGTTYTDSAVLPNHVYDYYLVTTDAVSAVGTSNRVTSFLANQNPLILGFIGDSNYGAGVSGRTTDAAIETVNSLQKVLGLRSVTLVNQSVGGRGMYSFVPSGDLYAGVVSAFNAASVQVVFIVHGYNDTYPGSFPSRSKAEYKADASLIISSLFADVPSLQKVILGYCFGIGYGESNVADLRNLSIVDYHAAQDELVNGTTILAGSNAAFRYIFLHTDLQTIDSNIHLNDAGCVEVGKIHAAGIAKALYATSAGTGIRVFTG